jgi:diphthine methyl ester synthase
MVGNTGLELYRFGQTTSIVFDDNNWLPNTPYNVIKNNQEKGLHTLCLLDIKTAEPSLENLRKGIKKAEPPRFMTIKKGIEILEKLEEQNKEGLIKKDTIIIGVARIGTETEQIITGTIDELKKEDFKEPLHSIIIPGKLHDIEKEMLKHFKSSK